MGPEGWWEGTETFKSLERILEAQHKGTWLGGSGAEIQPMRLWPTCVSWLRVITSALHHSIGESGSGPKTLVSSVREDTELIFVSSAC